MLPLHRQEQYRARYRRMHAAWQPATSVYEHLVQKHVSGESVSSLPGLQVLDVGCGAGGILERLAPQIARPYGIDRDVASLHRQRANISRIAGSTTALPFAPATLDLVICSWLLEHLAEPIAAVAEMARVLKPKGHLVFLTPHAHHWLVRLNRLVPRLAQARLVQALYARAPDDTFPVTYQLNTPAAITRIAGTVGLEAVALSCISDLTYLAFNDFFFALSVLLERLVGSDEGIHLVGDFVKISGGR